ncbi:MAG TPA: (2Fe-2S)-binding protein [Stellaceae bacterium]|jgi:predicted molibdopterin-dependent oxidoreductase YjgC
MFRRRPDSPGAAPAATVAVTVEGRPLHVPAGATAAAAFFLAGLPSIRETSVRGTPRAPYCLMGVCYDCLAEIDGIPNRQACMVTVRDGMRIRRQHGARASRPHSEDDSGEMPAAR